MLKQVLSNMLNHLIVAVLFQFRSLSRSLSLSFSLCLSLSTVRLNMLQEFQVLQLWALAVEIRVWGLPTPKATTPQTEN